MKYTVTTRKKLPRNKYGDVDISSSSVIMSGGSSGGSSSGGSSSGGSQYYIFTAATSESSGTAGLVPAPPAGSNTGTYILDAATASWKSTMLLDKIAYGQPPVPGRNSCIMPMQDNLDIGASDAGLYYNTAYVTNWYSTTGNNYSISWNNTYQGLVLRGNLFVDGTISTNEGEIAGADSDYVTASQLTSRLSNYPTFTSIYNTLNSYVRKSELSAQSYVTTSQLSSFASDYATKAYVQTNFQPIGNYVTGTQLSNQSYLTRATLNTYLDTLATKTFVDTSVSSLDSKLTNNLNENYPTYSYINSINAEWYNIRTERISTGTKKPDGSYIYTTYTFIENFSGSQMMENIKTSGQNEWVDPTKYRFVLLTYRRHITKPLGGANTGLRRTSRNWRVPMFSSRWDWDSNKSATYKAVSASSCPNRFTWYTTWWTIWGTKNLWFWNYNSQGFTASNAPALLRTENNTRYVINNKTGTSGCEIDTVWHRWKNNKNKKKRIGCAIYKYTGKGRFGWQRVSNIAWLELFVTKGDEVLVNVKE